ncbi:uncharacterized protein BO97DRAFT_89939 [Aspergillus homomorphus CBS 101889]|uniref:Transmembrane protein n=1 Tax=Aspergillus homomorphus (strain CBS 101889) TaxID=1450537 RepID=A0A395HVI8_ASPHC|nr:hypothetical protein BO97DRAFT_89939 [Aspergillus homomorphus CBS 101889]RAL11941.1 hypothetical protein BO97DRAFT_89939 [Aspergillus homomorphus CBS 101889]
MSKYLSELFLRRDERTEKRNPLFGWELLVVGCDCGEGRGNEDGHPSNYCLRLSSAPRNLEIVNLVRFTFFRSALFLFRSWGVFFFFFPFFFLCFFLGDLSSSRSLPIYT